MKKFLLVALFALTTVMFTSCSKDKDLTGTKWFCSYSEEETRAGFTYNLTLNITLNFTDATNGTMKMDEIMTSNGVEIFNDTNDPDNNPIPYTWTFDGENGTMTADGETIAFAYDKKANTITIHDTSDGETLDLVFNEK